VHAAGRRARALVETTRERLADLVGVHPRDVVLTSGGTEANNLALSGAPALIVSRLEHPSVTRVAERLEGRGVPVTWLPDLPSGQIDLAALEAVLSGQRDGFIVAVQAANHETGVLQPIDRIRPMVRAAGGRLHVDAVQAVGKVPATAWLGADSLAVAAHKLRGPKGIGALAWSGPPPPVLVGGAQERGLRPGTLDPLAAAGFGRALEHAAHGGVERYARLSVLRDRLEQRLSGWTTVNGAAPRLPHVSNLSVRGWRGAELVAALDLLGVRLSSGSACSAGTTEPSPVVTEMVGHERAASAIRLSLGDATRDETVDRAIGSLIQLLERQISGARDFGGGTE
jgi:cysteine desulfurase